MLRLLYYAPLACIPPPRVPTMKPFSCSSPRLFGGICFLWLLQLLDFLVFLHSSLYYFVWNPIYFDTQTLLVLSLQANIAFHWNSLHEGSLFFLAGVWVSDPPPETVACFVMQLFSSWVLAPFPGPTWSHVFFHFCVGILWKVKRMEPFCNSQQMLFPTKNQILPSYFIIFLMSIHNCGPAPKGCKSNFITKHRMKPTSLAVAGWPLKLPMTTFERFLRAPPPPADLVDDCISEGLTFSILKLHFSWPALVCSNFEFRPTCPIFPYEITTLLYLLVTIVTPCSLFCLVSWFSLSTVGTLGDRIGFACMSPEKKFVKINPIFCKNGVGSLREPSLPNTVWCDTTVRMGLVNWPRQTEALFHFVHCYPPKVELNDKLKMMQILRNRTRTGIVPEITSNEIVFIAVWFLEVLSFFSPGGSATTVANRFDIRFVLAILWIIARDFLPNDFFIPPQRCGLSRKHFPLIFSTFVVFVFPPFAFIFLGFGRVSLTVRGRMVGGFCI